MSHKIWIVLRKGIPTWNVSSNKNHTWRMGNNTFCSSEQGSRNPFNIFLTFPQYVKFPQQSSDHLKSHRWSRNQRNTERTKGCNILSCHKSKVEGQARSAARRGWISQCCCMAVTCWHCWKLHAEVKESVCWMIFENSIMGRCSMSQEV